MAPQAIGQGADVKAMLAANPNAGLYICTPNNPTGTVTSLADIQWLLDNKPAGSMVLVDEAYFSEAPSAVKLLGAQGPDRHAHLLEAVRHGRYPPGHHLCRSRSAEEAVAV
jgi:histidinol-phosphate/aromatic aminotransferase/cobyric acid decarboxylase-like protein